MTTSLPEFYCNADRAHAKSWTAALMKAARRAVSRIGTERRIRSEIGALMGVDDRMLKDIGISRSDIVYVVRYGRRP